MLKEPIRVLHICQRMEAAGVQSFLMNIYRNIDRDKIQFDFLVHYSQPNFFDEEIEKMGGKIYRFTVREDYNVFKYWRDLKKFFREHREYNVVHGHMDALGAVYLMCAKKTEKKIRIAHAHSASVEKSIKRPFRLYMIKNYSKYANVLMACSDDAGKFMFGNKEYLVINNAIDTKKYSYNLDIRNKKRNQLGITDELVIGNVGRFHVAKNQLYIIEILAELLKNGINAKLLLIGSGDLEHQIKAKIKNLNLEDKAIILSNRKDVNELYQAMDFFLLPSIFEGLPVAGIEAQASGLPCLFSDTITKQSDVTGNVWYVSIDKEASHWAKLIDEINEKFVRKEMMMEISNSGYDAVLEAKKLQDLYMELHHNGIREE